ncbi:unnamed protein product [Prorocentrum cordatum]|uniref:Glutamine amidotransferase type-2 domain-containing protein n=1 Tax=Prorocentrum cordatum TaxID=2364126 RepID=A0ABN9W7M3_9DINO|nr:unnamed protein product [Polarella glacialis]
METDCRSPAEVVDTAKLLRHRGPDWSGVFCKDRTIIAHERLAIVDPDRGAAAEEDKSIVLGVNGEIYNHVELQEKLEARAPGKHKFKTKSDCEVLLHLYAEDGPDFLAKNEDLLANFAAMANLTYAGRIYQNPMKPKEIWANIGWNTQGNQLFPPWEPALRAHVAEGDYNKIMDALRSEFANSPTGNFALSFCAMMLCQLTLGILSCPLCYLKLKINEFNAKLKELPGSLGLTGVRIEMTEMAGAFGGNWVDSKGQPLMMQGQRGSIPGGPPLGYNVIFTLPASLSWPPNGAPGQHMMAAPATAVVIGAQDVAQKITSLKQLLDAGALTQEEFDAKKHQLMDQI